MKGWFLVLTFFFGLSTARSNSDSVLIYVSDFSSEKVQPLILQSLSSLPGVVPVSYCEGDDTFFMLIDRNLQTNNTQIIDAIAGVLGGTLQVDIRSAAGLEYQLFLTTCERKIVPLGRITQDGPNSSGQ